MPDLSLYQSDLRAREHERRVYLSDLSGDVVATFAASAAPSSVSAMNVAVTLTSGDAADVQRGMRVVVETAAGLPKGVLHVRSNGTISSTNLPLREFSKGQVAVSAGDVLKVYDDFPLVDKLTDATANFAPDGETYTDQYSDPKPLIGSGGHWAGWLADASAVSTDGSASLNLDPDTADTLTHAWATTGGALSASNVASPTLDFSAAGAGKYRATHTVAAANGKSRAQALRFRVHDADDMPYVVTEESQMQSDPDNGWAYSVRVYDADAFALSPLAPVIIWVDETIAGERQSFGAKVGGRSHIKCMGYLRRARSGWDADEGRYYVIYDIVSALEMLRELPGFSKVFQHANTPTSWNEQKALTLKRAWLYLALYYTNANEAGHDLVLDDGGMMDMAYSALFMQKTNPLDQWTELAAGADCRVTCDRSGRIECQQRLECVDLASRGAVVTTLTLTKADIVSYEMEHDFKEPVETYRARGFTAGSTGNNPLFARWPASPGYGNQSPVEEKLVANNLGEFYPRAARRGAYQNKSFTDANRVKRHAPRMTVRLPGSYDAFDLYKEWVGVNITDEPRIVDTSVFRWLVERIGVSWEDGTGSVELTLQAETNGYDAVDDTPPAETDNGLGTWTPPASNWDLFPLPEVVWNWDKFPVDAQPAKVILLGTGTAQVARAYELPSSGGAVFEVINTGVTGTPIWLRSDPYNYARKFLTTTTGLFVCEDAWAASPTWSLVKAAADFPSMGAGHYVGVFQMSINDQGFMYFTSGNQGYRSYDYGQTITGPYMMGVELAAHTAAGSESIFDITHYNEGVMVAVNFEGWPGWAGGYRYSVSKSLDWGATWSTLVALIEYSNTTPGPGPSALIPYKRWNGAANNNADGQLEWWYKSQKKMVQYVGLAGTGGVASASYSGGDAPVPYNAVTVTSGQRVYGAYGTGGLFRIDPTNVVTTLTSAPVGGPRCGLQGFGMNPDVVFAYQDNVVNGAHLSFDAGLTWTLVGANGWQPRYMELDLSDYIPPAG